MSAFPYLSTRDPPSCDGLRPMFSPAEAAREKQFSNYGFVNYLPLPTRVVAVSYSTHPIAATLSRFYTLRKRGGGFTYPGAACALFYVFSSQRHQRGNPISLLAPRKRRREGRKKSTLLRCFDLHVPPPKLFDGDTPRSIPSSPCCMCTMYVLRMGQKLPSVSSLCFVWGLDMYGGVRPNCLQ